LPKQRKSKGKAKESKGIKGLIKKDPLGWGYPWADPWGDPCPVVGDILETQLLPIAKNLEKKGEPNRGHHSNITGN
jgi:hypothetical protein